VHKEISTHQIQQAISKKNSRLVVTNGGTTNVHLPQTTVSFSHNGSAKSKLYDIKNDTMRKVGSKKTAISGCKSVKPGKKALAQV
jgi:hypothetical protein